MNQKLPNLRWWVAGILFAATVLNYLDRQSLSILAPTIQKELGLDDAAYARVTNLFLTAYTLSYLFSGRLADKWGTRRSMALFVGWWSAANMLTGLARSMGFLGTCRFLLGLGEAGVYTAGPKAVSEWFPARERGTAIGIYTLGAALGATIAPPLVLAMAARGGWQAAFAVTGALGFVWLIPWLVFYHSPNVHPRLSVEGRAAIVAAASGENGPSKLELGTTGSLWRDVLRRKDVWALTIARLLTDPVWYFYQFWLAKYLHSDRGIAQEKLGITWVVFLAADIGTLVGGMLSGRLIKAGRAPAAARVAVMAVCAAPMLISPLVANAPSLPLCLGLAMVMVFCHMTWMVNLSALVVDRLPKTVVATAFGIIAAGSTAGGIAMNSFVGWLVTKHPYGLWFAIMAFLHPVAWLVLRAAGVNRMPGGQTKREPDVVAKLEAAAA